MNSVLRADPHMAERGADLAGRLRLLKLHPPGRRGCWEPGAGPLQLVESRVGIRLRRNFLAELALIIRVGAQLVRPFAGAWGWCRLPCPQHPVPRGVLAVRGLPEVDRVTVKLRIGCRV